MVALYRNALNHTVPFDTAVRQIQIINHSFKKHSVKFKIKSMTNNSSSCSEMHACQAVPPALGIEIRETFSFSDFFKGLLH